MYTVLLIALMSFGLWWLIKKYMDYRLFQPQPFPRPPKRPLIKIQGDDGILYADYLRHAKSKGVILCCHGNQGNIVRCEAWSEQLYALGYDILLYDYPGYGISQGKPSESSLCSSVLHVYDYLVQHLNYPPKDIVVFGRSLGGGPSCYLAAKRPLKALMLDSTFKSAQTVLLPCSLPGDRFKNERHLQQVQGLPILIIHGTGDQLIAVHHAKMLCNASKKKNLVTLALIEQADHHNIVYFDTYWQHIKSFLNT